MSVDAPRGPRKGRRGLIPVGITLMVLSTAIGFGMAAYAVSPMISGFLSLASGTYPTMEMPDTMTLPEGHAGGFIAAVQSGGAVPAVCTVNDASGNPVALEQANTVGSQTTTRDGRQIRVLGLFSADRPGRYMVSCDGSGDFGVVEYDLDRGKWLLPSLLGFPIFAVGAVLVIVGLVSRRNSGPPVLPPNVEPVPPYPGGNAYGPGAAADPPLAVPGRYPADPPAPAPAAPSNDELPRRYGG